MVEKKVINPIAELDKPDSFKIITAEEADKIQGKKEYYCPDKNCKDPNRRLILSHSKYDLPFFKHYPEFQHDIFPQTLLHKLAVQWYKNKSSLTIPEAQISGGKYSQQVVNLKTISCEHRGSPGFIPDVYLETVEGFKFIIEIVVTNDIDKEKSKLIREIELPTIAIYLNDFYKDNQEQCRYDQKFVSENLNSLLTDIQLQEWFFDPLPEAPLTFIKTETANTNDTAFGWFGGVIIVLIFLYTFFGGRKK